MNAMATSSWNLRLIAWQNENNSLNFVEFKIQNQNRHDLIQIMRRTGRTEVIADAKKVVQVIVLRHAQRRVVI